MTIASKLTQSVRQAKASAVNEQDATGADAVAPSPKTTRPRARKKPEPESPIVPFPSRRVWPD